MIPKFSDFMPRFLQSLSDGETHSFTEILDDCAARLSVSDDERKELTPRGHRVFYHRATWAGTYLKKAGLVESVGRGRFRLTDDGRRELANGSEHITVQYLLENYASFREFYRGKGVKKRDGDEPVADTAHEAQTPKELLEASFEQLNALLADDLMAEIMKLTPYDFEKLVVRLLIRMGYGSPQLNEGAVTRKSGDDGIDGVVTSDKLGFDSVYIQAKQWKKDTPVGAPEIRKFAGALTGQGAVKGLFITTSKFTKGAEEYVNRNLHIKIVLVDGEQLTKLMIEHDLGVSTVETYRIKRVDSDFFNDEI